MKVTILQRPTELTTREFKARLQKELEELKGDLTASTALEGYSQNGWAQISVTGQDSEIVTELISGKFGLAHTSSEEIEAPGIYEAQITGSTDKGLRFDVGDPRDRNYTIPTHNLIAQLADGRDVGLRQVIECYCLYPGVRISVRIDKTTGNEVGAWLSDKQIDLFSSWITTGLDRILVFECYRQAAEAAVVQAHLSRDIIEVEPITLTLQSVECKLGTDAVGLIPKLGRILRKQKLRPFLPKKIIGRCRPW
jgi:hypothetical protein